MFDCHYDLLTFIYINRNNISIIKNHCSKIFNNNLSGGIFNLFFMSKSEMQEELNISSNELDIINMLETVNNLITKHNLIPDNINCIFGIEGLDYLKDIKDLEKLYQLGVRSVNPVWNNQNQFGGGIKSSLPKGISPLDPIIYTPGIKNEIGLSTLGEKLIRELVRLKIAIDLSHTNNKTFNDIIELCKILKKQKLDPIVFASHSNSRKLCNIPRNLTDEQILSIRDIGGIIGIVSHKRFCRIIDISNLQNLNADFSIDFLSQIDYVKNLLGDLNNVSLSTDNMSYYPIDKEYYQNVNIFKHNKISVALKNLLVSNGYSNNDIDNLMYKNIKKNILSRLL